MCDTTSLSASPEILRAECGKAILYNWYLNNYMYSPEFAPMLSLFMIIMYLDVMSWLLLYAARYPPREFVFKYALKGEDTGQHTEIAMA
jgi:hypothetical protein